LAGTAILLLLHAMCSSAAVVGLDMGSSFIKVGVGRHGKGIQIALNEFAKRKTATTVAFHPEGPRRLWGDDATNLAARHPGLALPFPNAFLGLRHDSENAQELRKAHAGMAMSEHGTRRSVMLGAGKPTLDSTSVPVETAVAMLLEQAVNKIGLEAQEKKADGVVITVPGWMGQHGRLAMLDAATIADIPVLSLMNDHAAVALRYAMDNSFAGQKRLVLFFDMGGGGTTVSIVEFSTVDTRDDRRKTVDQVQVLAAVYSEMLGGRAFDNILKEILVEAVNLKHPGTQLSVRALCRLQKEAEKARRVLSANKEYQVNVESLTDTIDLRTELTRHKFEERAKDLFNQALKPIQGALAQVAESREISLRTLHDQLHSVETVGGAARMPAVQNLLIEFFGKPKMSSSLNGDEAAALGATYYAAGLRGYNIRPVNLVDVTSQSVQLSEAASGGQLVDVFGSNARIPGVVRVPLSKETSQIWLQNEAADQWTGTIESTPSNASSTLLVGIDRSGIMRLEGVQRFVEIIKSKGPSGWKMETSNVSALTPVSSFAFGEERVRAATKLLTLWNQHDDQYRERAEAQNGLESFLFAARDQLETEEITSVSTQAERDALAAAIEQADEWLLTEESADAVASLFREHQASVQKLLSPLQLRQSESTARPQALNKSKGAVAKVGVVVTKLKAKPASNDTAVANATSADISRLESEVQSLDSWIQEQESAQTKLAADVDPVVLSKDVTARTKALLLSAAGVAKRNNLTAF